MTNSVPRRLTWRQCMQIFLTDAFTFMVLVSSHDTRSSSVRIELQLDAIAHEHFDPMQSHFASKIREHERIVAEANTEQRVRKRLFDDSFRGCWFCHMVCVDKSNKNNRRSQILGWSRPWITSFSVLREG